MIKIMNFRRFTKKKCLLKEEKAVQFPPCLLSLACLLNYFSKIFNSARLIQPARLKETWKYCMYLIWPASVWQIFFRCLIFNCYDISICKKEKLKDETSKKIRETNGGQIKEQDIPLTWDSPQVCMLVIFTIHSFGIVCWFRLL